jgi:hypothetical protein
MSARTQPLTPSYTRRAIHGIAPLPACHLLASSAFAYAVGIAPSERWAHTRAPQEKNLSDVFVPLTA